MSDITSEDFQYLTDKGADSDVINAFRLNGTDDQLEDMHDRIQHEMDMEMEQTVNPDHTWDSDIDGILSDIAL